MEFEKFLEEYNELNISELELEQLYSFRSIFVEHGMIEKSLELSEEIYNRNKEDESAIVGYVDNLMQLGKRDEALLVLFNSPKTAQTLLLEGLIYKEEMLLDVAENKFKEALTKVYDDEELKNIIDYELSNVYVEVGRSEDALKISSKMFEENPNEETLQNLIDNLMFLGKFEEAVDVYKNNSKKIDINAHISYSVAYAYNQIEEFDSSKEMLLKTLELDNEFVEAYMHLGLMSKGQEAINYLEKYIELQGQSHIVYLQLTSLYKQAEQYDKIRSMVRDVLRNMGIDFDSLYIAINALRNLYETEKIYEIYKEHSLIKEDSSLLALTLLSLSEEEDYIDFVESEAKKHHPFLREENHYYEMLQNVYEVTGDSTIKEYIYEIDQLNNGIYFENSPYHSHDGDCDCGHDHHHH